MSIQCPARCQMYPMNSRKHQGIPSQSRLSPHHFRRPAARHGWSYTVLLLLAAVFFRAEPAPAQAESPPLEMNIEESLELDTAGSASLSITIAFPPAVYASVIALLSPEEEKIENGKLIETKRPPAVGHVLRYLGLTSSSQLIEDLEGKLNDEASTITAKFRNPGRAIVRADRWELGLRGSTRLPVELRRFHIEGTSITSELVCKQPGFQFLIRKNIKLPEGASEISLSKGSATLTYRAVPRFPADAGQASLHPSFQLDAKPELMSALYKVYGTPDWSEFWAARVIIRNTTANLLSDVRVRFRIEGFSGWSPWQKVEVMYPGQTIVEPFFPVFEPAITRLRSGTPALLEVEYEYSLPDARKMSNNDSARIRLLGMNEAVWTSHTTDKNSSWYEIFRNAPPIVASFVSADDPVIQDVVGMISRAIQGEGSTLSDEGAMAFLGALYNLFRENIAYENTPGGLVDGFLRQHLKYGRDVLRTRSGTCVNLAILYASVAEATGLEPSIIVVPGHAFVKVALPMSGRAVFVETTGCGGGTRETSYGFFEAQVRAMLAYQTALAAGKVIEVAIPTLRQQGIRAPELPDLGTHPLQDWKIQDPKAATMPAIPTLLATASVALAELKLPFKFVEDSTALTVAVPVKPPAWSMVISTNETTGLMLITSLIPGSVSKENRTPVINALNRLNVGLLVGNFELSDAGTVSLRHSIDGRTSVIDPSQVKSAVSEQIRVMAREISSLVRFTAAPANGQSQPASTGPVPSGSNPAQPQAAVVSDPLQERAAVNGKYSKLLKVLAVPGDRNSFGEFKDFGPYPKCSYGEHKDLPAGYWVYLNPNWYIWGEMNGKGASDEPLRPVSNQQPAIPQAGFSIVGTWGTRFVTDQGHHRTMSIRYGAEGTFGYSLRCQTGYTEAAGGRYTYNQGALTTVSGDQQIRSTVRWISKDRFILSVGNQSFTYDRANQ